MPKDIDAIKERTDERHKQVHTTFKQVYRKHTRKNIRPDYDDVVAEVAAICLYAASTVNKILKKPLLNTV